MPWAQAFAALVALASVALYLFMGARVGAARAKYQIAAPATSGNPIFERIFRVQQNTLEQLPVFLVGLYFFAAHLSALIAAVIGLIWLVGRILYMQTYIADPSKRGPGVLLTFGSEAVLVLGGIVGVALSIM
jgi:glutathione S-transferase